MPFSLNEYANFLNISHFINDWFPSRSIGPEPPIKITRLEFDILFGSTIDP